MNLDDISSIKSNDPQDMLAHILALPDQLDQAWQLGCKPDLPPGDGIQQVLIAGMGGSAIGADLLEAYIRPICRVPVTVHRDYGLPAWAAGEQTLVIASSHSGNTEETLSAFTAGRERSCRLMAVSTGGTLKEQALAVHAPVLQFEHHGQPRSAVGFSFGLLLAAFTRLGLIPDQAAAIKSASTAMREQMKTLIPESPVKDNPAKRLAGQVVGRLPVIVGADFLTPVARRWKGQFNELAKSWAQYDSLPEFDHNSLAGLEQPDQVLPKLMVLFLNAAACPPDDRLRVDLTRRVMMTEGINTDIINARGAGRLEAAVDPGALWRFHGLLSGQFIRGRSDPHPGHHLPESGDAASARMSDSSNLVFIKLGGSLITDKHKPRTPHREIIKMLASTIKAALERNPGMQLLIGHGSGSFGHTSAARHGTRDGVRSSAEWQGFLEVWRDARELNRIVIEIFSEAGLPVMAFSPSATTLAADGHVAAYSLDGIKNALANGLIPVVHGDVVFDTARGGTILSTEELFVHLAGHLSPRRILLAGLEPGVWADFPICSALVSLITPVTLAGDRGQTARLRGRGCDRRHVPEGHDNAGAGQAGGRPGSVDLFR